MSISPSFLRSLVLTSLISFIAPIALVIVLLATFSVIGYIPMVEPLGQTVTTQLLQFLAVFGSGCPLQGVMLIGFVCSLVGALFDIYACYRYQILNDH